MGIYGGYSLSPPIIPLFLISVFLIVSMSLFMLFLNSEASGSGLVGDMLGILPGVDRAGVPMGVFEPESGHGFGLSGS